MNAIEIITPAGYKVYLKDKLKLRERLELDSIITEKLKLQIGTMEDKESAEQKINKQITEIPGSVIQEQRKAALKYSLLRIVKDGQEVKTNLYEEVLDWDEDNGGVVLSKAEALHIKRGKEQMIGEKKEEGTVQVLQGTEVTT